MKALIAALLSFSILTGCQTAPQNDIPLEIVEFAEERVMLISDHDMKGTGSGFILSNNIVITACHVVRNNPDPVGYSDKWVTEFTVIMCNEDYDVAILKRTGGMEIEVESILMESEMPRQGTAVYGAGHGHGLPLHITLGHWQRELPDGPKAAIYLITAPTINGDSGSPVLVLDSNRKVHIIGMRVAIRGQELYGGRMAFGGPPMQAPITHLVLAVPGDAIAELIIAGTEELP